MTDEVKDIIKQLGVAVIVGDLDNPGYYNPVWNAIFISQSLTESEHYAILLHELGHAAKQRDEMALYKATKVMQSKMECSANRFMIRYLLQNYISVNDDDPKFINYLDFMRANDIPGRDESMVREIIAEF